MYEQMSGQLFKEHKQFHLFVVSSKWLFDVYDINMMQREDYCELCLIASLL